MRWVGVSAIAAGALLALPAPSMAAPGDVFVMDSGAQPERILFEVPAAGGPPEVVADGPPFAFPDSAIFDRRRRLLLADSSAGKIFSVDPVSGSVTTFLESPALPEPVAPALGADGQLYVGNDIPLGLFRVNPATKEITPLADATGVPDWASLYSMVIARDLTLYFTDGNDEVFQRPPGGPVSKFYEGPALSNADGLVLSADERTLYVANGNVGGLIAIDRATRIATPFATTTSADGLGRLLDGSVLSGNGDDKRLERISPSGAVTTFSESALYGRPHGIAVQPPRCGGRLATVVGTTSRDVLRGSRFADVIASLAGNDAIKGLGGNDVICGDGGNDRLLGGKGRDRLLGAAGRDRLLGGRGADRLLGGKGRDRLLGGLGRDRLRSGPGRDLVRQ